MNPLRLLPVILMFVFSKAGAQAPPASFTAEISRTTTDKVTVDFVHHPIRHANFSVVLVQADGSTVAHTPLSSRTYLGTVQGRSGAIACGWLRPDGTLYARVAFEDGVEWVSTGGNASVRGSTTWQPEWPTTEVPSGGAGGIVHVAETGVDISNRHFVACGGTPHAAVGMAEYAVMSTNYIFLRDAAILHQIGKVFIRMSSANDPYETPTSVTTNTLLNEVKNQWNNVLTTGGTHRVALVAHPSVNGGLAWVGEIGNSSNRYSANDSDAQGDFSLVWRHEVGHNWGSNHYEGGGRPEGPTIMSDNSLPRFSSPELAKIIALRNSRASFLEPISAYPFPLPPRASADRIQFAGASTNIDVLANDSDSNGDAISILSFDETCSRGGSVIRLAGAGPGGRDLLQYSPHPDFQNGTGFFRYRIADATGNTATGYVMLRPAEDSFDPLHHWTLDESSGTTALNSANGPNGTHVNNPSINQPGATAVTGRGVSYDGNSQSTSIPALGLGGNSYTFTAWIRRNGSQASDAPILYSRNSTASNSSHTSLHLSSNNLRARWNGTLFTPTSNLAVPDSTWCLVAFSVSPTQAVLHLRTPSGLTSSTHSTTITAASFTNPFLLARNQPTSGNANLFFNGSIDDVRIFPGVLSSAQISALYSQAASPPDFTISQPESGREVNPIGTRFTAGSATSASLLRSVEFYDVSSNLSFGIDSTPPYSVLAQSLEPGLRTLGARAEYGDWGYRIEAPPVSYQVLASSRPAVTLAALGQPSYGGGSTRFVFTRNETNGSLEVPFLLGGTAVRNSDYTLAGNSVTFANGEDTAFINLIPAASSPSPGERNVTLSIPASSSFVTAGPSTVSVAFAPSVRSVASGRWNLATVWSDGQPAPVSGTQGVGSDYLIILGHVIGSHDQASNSQGMVARSLRISTTSRLDLALPHSGTLRTATYDVPRISMEVASTLRFGASVGSSGHVLNAPLEMLGDAMIQISGGSYEQFVRLGGAITGTGDIALQSISNAGAVTANLRSFTVLSAGNSYSGDWSIEHTPSGDDFGALRAGAVNALGSGGVHVLRRSQLINDYPGGLDSIDFITLSGQSSSLLFQQPTEAPDAELSLAHSTSEVVVGNASSTLGSLSGSGGTIRGSAAGATLAIHQGADGSFAGSIGQSLRLKKQGPARLAMTGTVNPQLKLEVEEGRLSPGASPQTISELTQTGGTLELPGNAAAPNTPCLVVTGAATFTGGTIEVAFPSTPQTGVPYAILNYASLTGTPDIVITHPGSQTLVAEVDPGDAGNPTVTATFREPVELTVLPSDPQRGSVTGSGTFLTNTTANISATALPGWRFIQWNGTGVTDPANPFTTVLVDAAKTVTAVFDRPRSTWIQTATGGSWSDVGNWNLAPLFISDEWLDFSTLDLSAANTSNLDGSRRIGGLRFGDVPTATHDWTLAPGSGGNLTLSTTTGLPPEIEVFNRSATITAALAGNQGFTKTGVGTLVLHHPGNTLKGPLNVTGGTLQIRDGSTNAPAIFDSITDRPITLQSGAILDLPRLHSFTLQTVNWQLPGITMNDGATLRFRAQVGSNAHQLPAPIDVSGTVTMNNHGGAFAQDVSLTGPLSGSGMIQYLATSGSSSSTTTRTLTVSNPENTYGGDWFVDYTGSTSDDFVALRPTASGALGTGSVTLDDRARLLGGTASCLNSLSGIIVAKPTATLDFQGQPWTQPAAVLDVRDGTVESGGASISIGSLLQSGGSIRLVAGASAPLVLGGDAVFTGGNILLTVTGNPAGQSFEILRYSGNLTGTPEITIVGADRLTPSIDFGDGTDDVITVTFPAGADLVWRGNQVSNPGVWDIDQTDNWVRGSTPDRFLQADHVRFDDSALSSNINLTGSASPSSVIFDHSVLDLTLAGPGALSGPVGIVKSGSARLTIASAQGHNGGMLVTLGEVTAGHPGAFGSGTVTLRHAAASSIPTRVNLSNATMANDFVLDTNAVTGDSGAIRAAPGNTLSELSGTLTVQSTVGDGGHLSSAEGGILRLSGILNSSGPVPVLHSGIFEMATSGGNLAELTLSKGTIRLAQADGIQPTLRLNLASSGPATLDLHGFSQTLAELRQSSTHSAQVTNSASSAATLVIDGTVDHSFGGSIADGSGPIGLVKRGTSRLTLAGTCDHSWGTFIEAGTLSLSTASLADVSTVAISTGAVLDLPHGQEDTVAGLVIDDVAQPPGKYDASRSSFITGSGSLIVTSGPITDPFEIWAAAAGLDGSPGKAAGFDEDPDGDGFANGLEWLLGGDPLDGRSGGLVTPAEDGGLVLSFTRNPQALGEVSLTVEYGGSLLDPWKSVVIGPASSGPDASGVTVEIDSSATPHEITVSIPASHSTNGRLFARLKAVRP